MSELLDFKARVDFTQARRDAAEFERYLNGIGIAPANTANFTSANNAMTRAIRDSMLETERLRQENIQLQNQWQRGAITLNELSARQRANTIARQEATAAARTARQAQVAVNGSYREAQQRLRELGDRIRSVEGGFNNLGRVQQARIREYRQLNDQLQSFDRQMGNHSRNIGNYQSVLGNVRGQLLGLVSTFASAGAIIGVGMAAFTQSLKSAAVRTSLEFTFGSVDLADAKLEQLLDTANRLGVNYNALVSSYKSFAGAVVASNFDFRQGERIFNAVAGASSRLKLSSEDTEGALRALQQMISKGNVQAEELRGQLGERIPGAFSIAARAIGVTESELNKMLQKGEVLAADLLPKLATELEKTFGLESTKQIEGMNAETEKFFNMFSGAVAESSNINKFFTTALKGFNEIFGTIFKMVNSDSWSEFWTRLTVGSGIADSVKGIESAGNQANRALSNSLNLPDNDPKKAAMVYEELSIAYDKVTKSVKEYQAGLKDGSLKDGGAFTLQSLQNSEALLKSKLEQVKQLLPDATKSANKVLSDTEKRAQENAIKSRNDLQAKIDELTKKGVAKQLDADDQEVESVKLKYAEMRRLAERFNNDSKNKKLGLRVDGSSLAKGENAEIDAIKYKQDTEKLKLSLDKQKELYERFEAYKAELGNKAANDRFGSEVNTARKYADVLQDEYDKVLKEGSKTGFTGAMNDRLKYLEKSINSEAVLENKRQEDLMKSLLDFDKRRTALTDKYNTDKADIITKGGGKDLDILDKNYKEQLAKLGDAHLQELDAFKLLYAGIDRLSDENALKVVGNAEDALSALKAKGVVISKELEAELRNLFADTRRSLAERLPDRLINLANQIDNIAGSVGDLDESFGKVLSTLGNVVGQVGNIKKGFGELQAAQKKGDTLGSLGAGLGILGAGISIFQSVFKLFDRSAQREEQAAYSRDLQNKQTEALNKALQRQVELLDEVYGTERIAKYSEAIAQAQANEEKYTAQLAGRYKLSGDAVLDKYITKLNNGESLGGMLSEKDFRKQLDKLGVGLPTDIASLQTLLDEGRLDASTATIVSNLIQANKTAQELANNLRAETVGAGLSTIVDEFITDLTDGMDGVEGSLQNAIRRGLLNGLKSDLTQKYIQEFYAQLDNALKDGQISSEEDAQLKALYKAAEEYGKQKLDYINSVAPESANGGSQDTLKGRIESITSNQADKLEGVFRAVQVNGIKTNTLLTEGNNWMAQTYQAVSGNLAELVKITANTGRTADNTTDIPAIKKALDSIDRKMNNGTNAMQGNGYTTGI